MKAFAGVEAALSSARPAAGWTPDALAGLREGLFGSRQQGSDAKSFSIEKYACLPHAYLSLCTSVGLAQDRPDHRDIGEPYAVPTRCLSCPCGQLRPIDIVRLDPQAPRTGRLRGLPVAAVTSLRHGVQGATGGNKAAATSAARYRAPGCIGEWQRHQGQRARLYTRPQTRSVMQLPSNVVAGLRPLAA